MDNLIKTIIVAVASLANCWLIFVLISGLYNKSAQWDLDVGLWLWSVGVPVVFASAFILIISAAQKQKMKRGWLITWLVNLFVPLAVFGALIKSWA